MPRPNVATTPTKSKFASGEAITPPSTGKAKKVSPAEQLQVELGDAVAAVEPKRKRGAFDSFQRKKASTPSLAGKGTKREGSPVVGEGAAKRTRSGVEAIMTRP